MSSIKLYMSGLLLAWVIGGLLWLNLTGKSPTDAGRKGRQTLTNPDAVGTRSSAGPAPVATAADFPAGGASGSHTEQPDTQQVSPGTSDVESLAQAADSNTGDKVTQATLLSPGNSARPAAEPTTAGTDTAEDKIQRVYDRELVVSLVNVNDASVGAIELVLNWESELMYPRNSAAVCIDSSASMVFQQGRVTPGKVLFGLIFPSISAAETELLLCQFNLVTDNAEQVPSVSVDGSVVYALDTSVIGNGADVIKVQFR